MKAKIMTWDDFRAMWREDVYNWHHRGRRVTAPQKRKDGIKMKAKIMTWDDFKAIISDEENE